MYLVLKNIDIENGCHLMIDQVKSSEIAKSAKPQFPIWDVFNLGDAGDTFSCLCDYQNKEKIYTKLAMKKYQKKKRNFLSHQLSKFALHYC